jgi:hypothetical protein
VADHLPSLVELAARAQRGEPDVLLTLRQAAEVTATPYNTIRRWVYIDRVLPTVPVGPFCQPRIPASALVGIFCQRDDGSVCIVL